ADDAFRTDLFYRLNVFPIEVPALRERPSDIALLVAYFVERYARNAGKTIRHVDKRTLELVQSSRWPGNVRELQNVIERAVIVCESETLNVDPRWLARQTTPAPGGPPAARPPGRRGAPRRRASRGGATNDRNGSRREQRTCSRTDRCRGQARDARFYAGIEDPSARDQQALLQGLLRYEGRPGPPSCSMCNGRDCADSTCSRSWRKEQAAIQNAEVGYRSAELEATKASVL